MAKFEATERTRVRRMPKRGVYDQEQVYSILDEALVCHLGFTVDDQPFVIPTNFGREEDILYVHGSAASRTLRRMGEHVQACITVTLLDGLVLARSAFHHSVNYRSVMIFGEAEPVTDEPEKTKALRIISEHIVPGRWDDVRQPTAQELKATAVLKLPINEVSAKVRTGFPVDDEEDYAMTVWAGVLPMRLTTSEPIPDSRLHPGIPVPAYIREYRR